MSQRTEKYRPTMAGDVLHSWAVDAQAEIDALRKDAERYRLVRRGQHWSVVDGIGDALRADELDAAIDAAIAAAEKVAK